MRTRIGVALLVRVGGPIVRKLRIVSLSSAPRAHALRLVIRNNGNINERLIRRAVTVVLRHNGKKTATLVGRNRDLLPGNSAAYTLTTRNRLSGTYTATVTIRPSTAAAAGPEAPRLRPITRTFRVALPKT